MQPSSGGRYALYRDDGTATVSTGLLLVCLALGAGAIAVWVYVRIGSGRPAPGDMRSALIHVGVSLVVGQLAVPLLMKLFLGGESVPLTLFAVFGIAFPALVYCLLASIWIIKMLQGELHHR
jgi:predicted Na+-dependent transporter